MTGYHRISKKTHARSNSSHNLFYCFFSVYPHGRKSVYALLMGIGSYLFLSVSMWSCVYIKIDGYLNGEFPYIERVSTDVRPVIIYYLIALFGFLIHKYLFLLVSDAATYIPNRSILISRIC